MRQTPYLAFASAAIMLSACSSEDFAHLGISNGKTIYATIEQKQTRSTTDKETHTSFRWTEEDIFILHAKEFSSSAGFKLVDAETGEFSSDDYQENVDYQYAIYPNITKLVIQDDIINVVLKSSYGKDYEKYTPSLNSTMLAEVAGSDVNTLNFRHLGGVFEFNFTNIPSGVNKFTFTCDKRITGSFPIDFNPETADGDSDLESYPVIITDDTESDNQVQISFSECRETEQFYVPVPTGSYNKVSVALYAGQTKVLEKTYEGESDVPLFNVKRGDLFYSSDTDALAWDGRIDDTMVAVDNVYTISTPAQLAGIAKIVNGGNNLSGMTVKLASDIDLGGLNWTPIGDKDTPFQGNFDGANFTVKNLKIDLEGSEVQTAGLFGYSWQANNTYKDVTIENVEIDVRGSSKDVGMTGALFGGGTAKEISGITVRNAEIKSYHRAGGIVGQVYSSVRGCKVENIGIELFYMPVENGKYDNGDKGGAIAGQICEGTYTLENNTAVKVEIKGSRDIGGMFGHVNYKNTVCSNNHLDTGLIEQKTDHIADYDGGGNFTTVGAIIGRLDSYVSGFTGNEATETEVRVKASGSPKIYSGGGTVYIEAEMDEIDLTNVGFGGNATKVILNKTKSQSDPTKIKLGNTTETSDATSPLVIEVAKDVEYPKYVFTQGSTVRNVTLTADSESDKTFEGFYFQSGTGASNYTGSNPEMLENFTIDGYRFKNLGFWNQYGCSVKNLTIKNCKFIDLVTMAYSSLQTQSSTHYTNENITIENCDITISDSAASSTNAINIGEVKGNIVVKDVIVRNAKYHGIRIFQQAVEGETETITVEGCQIENAGEDGIKIETINTAQITVKNNKMAGTGKNGIRIKNAIGGKSVTITGNSIDMNKSAAWNESDQEPWGILLINSSENSVASKVDITGNTITGTEHAISLKNINRTDDSTVQE